MTTAENETAPGTAPEADACAAIHRAEMGRWILRGVARGSGLLVAVRLDVPGDYHGPAKPRTEPAPIEAAVEGFYEARAAACEEAVRDYLAERETVHAAG